MKACLTLVLVLAILGSGCSPMPTPSPKAPASVLKHYSLVCTTYNYSMSFPSDKGMTIEPLTDQERELFKVYLACDVYGWINLLRQPVDSNSRISRIYRLNNTSMFKSLMLNDGTNRTLDQWGNYRTFASQFGGSNLERILGERESYQIAMQVCSDMGFTIEEVQRLYDQAPPLTETELQALRDGK
jgi:hypothetical protein